MRRNRLATAAPAPAGTEQGIPTLVDVVKAPVQVDLPAAQARAVPADLDDVPLLTDAVEEIEASSVLDEPDTADASMWSDTFTGVHSILGDEMPSADVRATVANAPADSTLAAAKPPLHLVTPAEALPPPPEAEALPLTSASPDEAHAEPVSAAAAEPIDISEPLLDTVEAAHADDTADVVELPAHPHDLPAAATTQSPPAADHDDARWNALAEEIRMQVLQRIDLFTDTGLREQLAVRLQPIVDRASADLVATINQHVGILLRAHVSEAIEREIERWRSQNR